MSQQRARQLTAYSGQLDRWIESLKDDAIAKELFGSYRTDGMTLSTHKAKLAELRAMHAETVTTADSVKDFVLTAEVRAQMARRDTELLERLKGEVDLPAFDTLTNELIVKLEKLVEYKLTAPPPEQVVADPEGNAPAEGAEAEAEAEAEATAEEKEDKLAAEELADNAEEERLAAS